MTDSQIFLTPVGRLVRGSVSVPKTTDFNGNPLVIKTGPNSGQPRTDYFFAIAVPKTDPGIQEILDLITSTAKAGFPNLFGPDGTCLIPNFSFKFQDGDSTIPNKNGTVLSRVEGCAGNWILNFSSGSPPTAYDSNVKSLEDLSQIKRGYYVRVHGSCKPNGVQSNPGVYLNHMSVQLVGYGPEIITDGGQQAFSSNAIGHVPQGMSTAPPAPAMAPPAVPTPAVPVTPPTQPVTAPPAAPAPTTVTAPPPAQPVTAPPPAPAYDYLNAPPKYVVQGNEYTKEQLLQAGYTEEMIARLTKADGIPF